jgi:hypothetical protein
MTSHDPDPARDADVSGDLARRYDAILAAHRSDPTHSSADIAAALGLDPVTVGDAIRELIARRRLRAAAVYASGGSDPTYMNLTEIF